MLEYVLICVTYFCNVYYNFVSSFLYQHALCFAVFVGFFKCIFCIFCCLFIFLHVCFLRCVFGCLVYVCLYVCFFDCFCIFFFLCMFVCLFLCLCRFMWRRQSDLKGGRWIVYPKPTFISIFFRRISTTKGFCLLIQKSCFFASLGVSPLTNVHFKNIWLISDHRKNYF